MLQFVISSLLLITNVKCQTICNKPEGCLDKQATFKEPLRWCTVSNNENEECQNLIKAASNLGYHNFTCVQRLSKPVCLDALRTNNADIVAVVNIPLGKNLNRVVATTTDKNPFNLTTFDNPYCVYKLYYKSDDTIEGRYPKACPSENFTKVLCTNVAATHCNYFNEIVMRTYDPNIYNVHELLSNLWDVYDDENPNHDKYRNFGDLLFQGYTHDFYIVSDVNTDPPQDPPPIENPIISELTSVSLGLWITVLCISALLAIQKQYYKKIRIGNQV